MANLEAPGMAISVASLSLRHRSETILNSVDLQIPEGAVVGLVGLTVPNESRSPTVPGMFSTVSNRSDSQRVSPRQRSESGS